MLFIQVFTDYTRAALLADFTGRASGVRFSTNRHGFASLSVGHVAMSLHEAFQAYEWPGTPHLSATDHGAGVVWEGRLEDIAIVPGGVSLTALGYQRALSDVPYTALWSKSGSGGWRPVTAGDLGGRTPERYTMDNNNRLYIAPKKGEAFGTGNHNGTMAYLLPHNGLRKLARFTASYDLTLPANWQIRIITADEGFTNNTVEQTITATGSPQSGSIGLDVTARDIILVDVRNNTGSTSTISADTGTNYVRLTDLRVRSVNTAVVASGIVGALVAHVAGINPAQLGAGTELIEATATDLFDEIYEDEYPADILDDLASRHTYEWGVWEDRRLHFRPRGSGGRHWYVDVAEILELQRSLDDIRNSAYGVYRDAGGRTLRTATATDDDSRARYAVTRRGFVNAQTTSQAQAEAHRDAWLADRANMQAQARIAFDRLYGPSGELYPLYMMRAGDTVTMRNLPPTLSTEIDRIRTFVVGETDYDATENRMDIAPETAVPTLVSLVAAVQRPKGAR